MKPGRKLIEHTHTTSEYVWIAKDGKEFFEDNIVRDYTPSEVEVIQYLRPDGKTRRLAADLGEEYVEKAKNLIISCEYLPYGSEMVIWVRRKDESDENERTYMAHNCIGLKCCDREPDTILRQAIDKESLK